MKRYEEIDELIAELETEVSTEIPEITYKEALMLHIEFRTLCDSANALLVAYYKTLSRYKMYLRRTKTLVFDEIMDIYAGVELVRNKDGFISAELSLEAHDDEDEVCAIKLFSLLSRQSLVSSLAGNKEMKANFNEFVPLWMSIHKLNDDLDYTEWEPSVLSMGADIFVGVVEYATYANDFPDIVKSVREDSLQYQHDIGCFDSFAPKGILTLPKDGESKGSVPKLPNRLILGMGWCSDGYRHKGMICNYDDWDNWGGVSDDIE